MLHIFGFLDYQNLIRCRLVCPYWYQLIKHDVRLIDRFRLKLRLNSGTVVAVEQPPFSIVLRSNMKLKSITIEEDFLDAGNTIAVFEANRSRMSALSTILTDIKAAESVTEMIVHARDNASRTNALLLEMIIGMKNVSVLKFTMPAFVHSLQTMSSSGPCNSLEYVQIMHIDCKRLITADFRRLFEIFPNINRIDVKTSEAMLLGENVLQDFAPFFKSIEKLESYTVTEPASILNLSLKHISYECCDGDDVRIFREFLDAQPGIETIRLKLLSSSDFFDYPIERIIDLDIRIEGHSALGEEEMKLRTVFNWTPKLQKLTAKLRACFKHQFGHDVIEMENLSHITLTRVKLNCNLCWDTMLKSVPNVTHLKLALHSIPVRHLTAIASNLHHLECLELFFSEVSKK